jgi:putative acetyltransferase
VSSATRNNFPTPEISPATTLEDVAAARELFVEYATDLRIDLCFQNFERELATLPGIYAPPCGCLFLGRIEGRHAGCVALRPMEERTCEIKRLYVRPEFRRRGLGKMLVRRALVEARRIGYRVVRLDTLREMDAAIALYRRLGFEEVAPYRTGEPPGICYFELTVAQD